MSQDRIPLGKEVEHFPELPLAWARRGLIRRTHKGKVLGYIQFSGWGYYFFLVPVPAFLPSTYLHQMKADEAHPVPVKYHLIYIPHSWWIQGDHPECYAVLILKYL